MKFKLWFFFAKFYFFYMYYWFLSSFSTCFIFVFRPNVFCNVSKYTLSIYKCIVKFEISAKYFAFSEINLGLNCISIFFWPSNKIIFSRDALMWLLEDNLWTSHISSTPSWFKSVICKELPKNLTFKSNWQGSSKTKNKPFWV